MNTWLPLRIFQSPRRKRMISPNYLACINFHPNPAGCRQITPRRPPDWIRLTSPRHGSHRNAHPVFPPWGYNPAMSLGGCCLAVSFGETELSPRGYLAAGWVEGCHIGNIHYRQRWHGSPKATLPLAQQLQLRFTYFLNQSFFIQCDDFWWISTGLVCPIYYQSASHVQAILVMSGPTFACALDTTN